MQTDIKALRTRMGLSQAELADRLATRQPTISRIELGKQRLRGPLARLVEQLVVEVEGQDETGSVA
jgi:transcriptional regulator with XRE-family HTH domain